MQSWIAPECQSLSPYFGRVSSGLWSIPSTPLKILLSQPPVSEPQPLTLPPPVMIPHMHTAGRHPASTLNVNICAFALGMVIVRTVREGVMHELNHEHPFAASPNRHDGSPEALQHVSRAGTARDESCSDVAAFMRGILFFVYRLVAATFSWPLLGDVGQTGVNANPTEAENWRKRKR